MMNTRNALTEKEVAAEYGPRYPFFNQKWLQNRRYLRRGGPRFLKIGTRVYYEREELQKFLQESLVDNTDVR
jgi:hypothetical protein